MKFFRVAIPGIEDTISHNVKSSLLEEIQRHINISDDIPIITTQDINEIIRDKWNLKSSSKDVEMSESLIRVSYSEELSEESGFSHIHENSAPPLFVDKSLTIRPVYLNNKVTLSVKIESRSKSLIVAARDRLRLTLLAGRETNLHSILYRYYMPNSPYLLIKYAFQYKINMGLDIKDDGTKESFHEYLISHSDNRATLVSTQAGNEHIVRLAYKENQSNVVGRYTFDLNKSVEYDSDSGRYSLEFEYSADYQKPTYMDVKYDIVIYNQQLPDELIATKMDFKQECDDEGLFSFITLDKMFLSKLLGVTRQGYVRLPYLDNHDPINRTRHETILISALITLEKNDKRSLFNLTDLGDVAFSPSVIEYLKYDHEHVTTPYNSLFSIYLYSNNREISNVKLILDADLNLSAATDLDLNNTYRVYIVLNHNRTLMTIDGKNRLDKFLSSNDLYSKKILLSLDNEIFSEYLKEIENEDLTTFERQAVNRCMGLNTNIECLNNLDKARVYVSGLLRRECGLDIEIPTSVSTPKNKSIMKLVQSALIITHFERI